jgi:hypothetical protein
LRILCTACSKPDKTPSGGFEHEPGINDAIGNRQSNKEYDTSPAAELLGLNDSVPTAARAIINHYEADSAVTHDHLIARTVITSAHVYTRKNSNRVTHFITSTIAREVYAFNDILNSKHLPD